MSVDAEISSIFGRYTGNVLNMKVEGKTVRECLHDLVRQYPKLKKMLLDKDGNLMPSYDFYINGQSVYPKDMTRPLNPGDKLNVVFRIQGG
ncbi:MAG: MoaD/ThiS family protein [Dehalococcoidales bacterium]